MDARRVLESNHSGSVLEGDKTIDKEELMVEVVGSDVFVDGFSRNGDDDDDDDDVKEIVMRDGIKGEGGIRTRVGEGIVAGPGDDFVDVVVGEVKNVVNGSVAGHTKGIYDEMLNIDNIEAPTDCSLPPNVKSKASLMESVWREANHADAGTDADMYFEEATKHNGEEGLDKSSTANHVGVSSKQDHITEIEEHVDACADQELKVQHETMNLGESGVTVEKIVKQMSPRSEISTCEFHSRYLRRPINEGEYSINDLVWGKVKRNLWWPGQILNPADASVKAMKHYKNDCFLVGYFGDCTFAWNDTTRIRPFMTHLSLIKEQITSEAFHHAVRCAVDEVSRQVELGLACLCIPKKSLADIESQISENIGIFREVGKRYVAVESTPASCFEPGELLEHIKLLAILPSASNDDQLHLAITKAQLTAFSRFKERPPLPESHLYKGMMENNTNTLRLSNAIEDQSEYGANNSKRKGKFANSIPPRKKGRHMSNFIPVQNHSSLDEMLSQLHLVAQDPMKGYNFLNNITTFFSSFRQSLGTRQKNQPTERRGRKKRAPPSIPPVEFEFDDLNDSNQRDGTIQNCDEEQPLDTVHSGRIENDLVHYEADKPKTSRGRPRKQFFGKHIMVAEEPVVDHVNNERQDCSQTVLVLKFPVGKFLPSNKYLNSLFRRFGPLREDETEVDKETNQAKVVYKSSSDAEVAFRSAVIFNIFEPMVVNYELTYVQMPPSKTSQAANITRPGG